MTGRADPTPLPEPPPGCAGCAVALDFEISMAFQPIVDVDARRIVGHEALVRGAAGEGAAAVFRRVTPETRYAFDQRCRVAAVELAARLGVPERLYINFLPNAVYEPAHCLRTTLIAAGTAGFPLDRITFEVTESERIDDRGHLRAIFEEYRRHGFEVAMDDFGAGHSGLGLLAEFQPDTLKLDMDLVRGIHVDRVRRAIVRGVLTFAEELGIKVLAEGVETREELAALRDLGIRLFQGYLFARPGFESLPKVAWP